MSLADLFLLAAVIEAWARLRLFDVPHWRRSDAEDRLDGLMSAVVDRVLLGDDVDLARETTVACFSTAASAGAVLRAEPFAYYTAGGSA